MVCAVVTAPTSVARLLRALRRSRNSPFAARAARNFARHVAPCQRFWPLLDLTHT